MYVLFFWYSLFLLGVLLLFHKLLCFPHFFSSKFWTSQLILARFIRLLMSMNRTNICTSSSWKSYACVVFCFRFGLCWLFLFLIDELCVFILCYFVLHYLFITSMTMKYSSRELFPHLTKIKWNFFSPLLSIWRCFFFLHSPLSTCVYYCPFVVSICWDLIWWFVWCKQ